MDKQNFQKNKNISGLSFKNISTSEFSSDNYLFVDDEIEGNIFFRDLKRKFAKFYAKQKSRNNIIEFVLALVEYVYTRFKIILVLLSVLFDIIFSAFNTKKNTYATKMFWGRGNFLSSALKILFIAVAFILSITYLYRKPVVTVASEVPLQTVGVAQIDLMVTNSTVNTAIPKDRGRRYTEEYLVKGGDTLASIAQEKKVSVESIVWANNMSSSSVIKPGQTLQIPPDDGVLVTVKKGETIYSLAKKYQSSDQAIADFNWIDPPFTLEVGQKIFVPGGKIVEPVAPKPAVIASTPSLYVKGGYTAPSASTTVVDSNVGRFLGWPLAGGAGVISQYYGRYHTGIDIASNALPNVVAPAGGTVIFAGCAATCPPMGSTYGGSGYAWSIQIDHGNGYTTWYAHLKNIYVRTGQVVAKGATIGQLGSTGRSTGPHVHFELRRGVGYGTQVNPIGFTAW